MTCQLPGDSYVPDILVASDVVQGKLGYGLVSECLASGIPLLYVSREYWAEERHLAEYMRSHHCCVRMTTDDFYDGNWSNYLHRAVLTSRGIRCRGSERDRAKWGDYGGENNRYGDTLEERRQQRNRLSSTTSTGRDSNYMINSDVRSSNNDLNGRFRADTTCQVKDITAAETIVSHIFGLLK